jgi:hypothetical protein
MTEHRVYIEQNGTVLSPFHDIPLFANAEKTILNMVVEIPRWVRFTSSGSWPFFCPLGAERIILTTVSHNSLMLRWRSVRKSRSTLFYKIPKRVNSDSFEIVSLTKDIFGTTGESLSSSLIHSLIPNLSHSDCEQSFPSSE